MSSQGARLTPSSSGREWINTDPPTLVREWANTESHSHLVQFYEGDDFLIDTIGRWFGEGLAADEASIFICTPSHRGALEERLKARGLDLETLRLQGRYIALDAAETLSKFMVEGWPDRSRFIKAIEPVVERASRLSAHGKVRAFGEMVALLWADRNPKAAIRLEEYWNIFLETHGVSLCCAYPLNCFDTDSDALMFLEVCAQHSPVIPAESYTALSTPAERLRSVSLLQQKAVLLETEKIKRREAEESLQLGQQELSDFIMNAVEGLHQLGPDGKILWANPAQLRLLGYSADEYVGHHIAEFYVDRRRFEEFWQKLQRREIVYDFQAALRCKGGSQKQVLIHSSGLWEGDKFQYTRCFIRDITERVQLEEELKLRAAQLAEADQRKNEFLAMLGHELRNPLSAVLGSIATAQLDETRRARALKIARRQTDQLAGLVDDLLDVARITQGRIALRKEPVRIGRIIKQAAEEAQYLVDSAQIKLTVSISAEVEGVEIDADPARLRQVIANLIDNAVKFTQPHGRIDLIAKCRDDLLVLLVRDTGSGIAPNLLPRVFDLFTQGDRSVYRVHAGLGIGLTLVKQIVELHGGQVEAKSEGLGLGSEFVISLPTLKGCRSDVTATAGTGDAPKRGRVLIVEDDEDAAEALMMLLELFGQTVTIVGDGPAAIDAVRSGDFDAALVDIGLPGIDGYEVARRIRMLPTCKPISLGALTGYGQEKDKQHALAVGFDEHLTKPMKVERLREFLSRIR